jgi:hypothetical protein
VITNRVADGIVRLPLYAGLDDDAVTQVIESVATFIPTSSAHELG